MTHFDLLNFFFFIYVCVCVLVSVVCLLALEGLLCLTLPFFRQLLPYLLAVYGSGFLGAAKPQALMPTKVQNPEWYDKLQKPPWNPPGWVFPVMWLLVAKPTQLAALETLRRAGGLTWRAPQVRAYLAHLALGDVWNQVFFAEQNIGAGLATIALFLGALWGSTALFWQAAPLAGKLMLPTCAWVAVASSLNLAIYLLNRPGRGGQN